MPHLSLPCDSVKIATIYEKFRKKSGSHFGFFLSLSSSSQLPHLCNSSTPFLLIHPLILLSFSDPFNTDYVRKVLDIFTLWHFQYINKGKKAKSVIKRRVYIKHLIWIVFSKENFPGDVVAKTLCSQYGGWGWGRWGGSIPFQGTGSHRKPTKNPTCHSEDQRSHEPQLRPSRIK